MDRNIVCTGGRALRIAIGLMMLVLLLAGGAGAATITVDDSGGAMYTKIQDAINAANDGDTITVATGTYSENIKVNKSVSLVGAGIEATVANALNPYDHVFNVIVNSVNITGFRVTGATYHSKAGIYLASSNNNNLTGNNVSNNQYGIYLYSSINNSLIGNNASSNGVGIYLYSSINNSLTGNNVSNNGVGIYLYSYSNNNTLKGNVFYNNNGIYLASSSNNNLMYNIIQKPLGLQGLLVTGTNLMDFRNNITASNTVNGLPLMYIDGVSISCPNNSVFSEGSSYSHITFVGCDNVTLQDTSVTDTITLVYTTNSTVKNSNSSLSTYGIRLISSSNNNISGNNVLDNKNDNLAYGIYLYFSSNNNISGNNALNNNVGIYLHSSNNSNITGNNVSSNYRGIYLYSSSNNNTLKGNDVTNNYFGFYIVTASNNNNLKFNNASKNYYGIYLYSSNNSNIIGNNALNNNYHGIYLSSSSNTTLMYNIIQKPLREQGLFVDGTILQDFRNNISTSNNVNGLPIMYIDGVSISCPNNSVFSAGSSYSQITFVGCDNVTLQDTSVTDTIILAFTKNSTVKNSEASLSTFGIRLSSSSNNNLTGNNALNNNYGIFLSSSSNNNLTGNDALNNNEGIHLYSSINNNLTGNDALNNNEGIHLYRSSNNNLIGNNASNNGLYGIFLWSSSNNNNLTGNNASNNGYNGIALDSSNSNTIFGNIFSNINNFIIVNSVYNNYWNITKSPGMNIIGGPYLGGNFWANPSGTGFSQVCTDEDGDGICDEPYILNVNNIDYLPLTSPDTIVLPSVRYINGTVIDSLTEDGIPGVRVFTNTTLSTTTNATGFYSFPVPDGAYSITATFEPTYYTNSSITVSTIGQAVVWQEIELSKKPVGNITGSVTKA